MKKTLAFFTTFLYKDFSKFCNEKLQKIGLSRGLLYFVIYIGRHPKCSPGNLSSELRFDSGHTTRAIEKLVQNEFVLREKSESDKRAYILSLTEKGEEALKVIYSLFSQWDEKVFSGIEEDERTQLISLMEKIIQKKGENKWNIQ
ncbi:MULTISPECIES: bilirubin utilization transcriptional regulator BilQ [Clostridium]|uniref:MarR family transcriptional regulator n=1 Tax=Clostridium cadaveris TaxID=1529 RepID=A0A316MA78_9CLOT|nr:bilirubin utilization transcriptional regulator BilQ [Clostridium cadaveris]MDU4951782.1 MarR family transcriptional regulator [Clostridium sp.]MDY4949351.1 MarR family transcriptional regulator [Clostridium cadaveris]NME64794.1 MarR family transcriptional regulator [Clostridium cadaveris]NWK12329.1 MarR family transcriptional regulator [Clostridium cadaveris]PWL53995.1 MAG: MarR family transcriptional regulator [Clostridium cadaveris]